MTLRFSKIQSKDVISGVRVIHFVNVFISLIPSIVFDDVHFGVFENGIKKVFIEYIIPTSIPLRKYAAFLNAAERWSLNGVWVMMLLRFRLGPELCGWADSNSGKYTSGILQKRNVCVPPE